MIKEQKRVDVSNSSKYIIRTLDEKYVKTGKLDTIDINRAKRFKSVTQAKNFIELIGVLGYTIIEVKDE
jgi:hypothetical protein